MDTQAPKQTFTETGRDSNGANLIFKVPELLGILDLPRVTLQYLTIMSLLSKLRLVTADVTGTLIAYKGELGDYCCMAAKSIGLSCPDYKLVHEGFKLAYTKMARKHPCFGFGEKIPKHCLVENAGYDYDEETFEKIFRRIYGTFGSSAPYTIFPDSRPFLNWLRGKGIIVGIVSNADAECRYQDVILPVSGLHKGSEWNFGVFSGLEGVEKPDSKMYEIVLERAGNIAPEEALHIGDSVRQDCWPAKSIGMNTLLLDRFKSRDAETCSISGATMLPNLVSIQDFLSTEQKGGG